MSQELNMLCILKQNIHHLRYFNDMIGSCVISHIEKMTPNSRFTLWYNLSTLSNSPANRIKNRYKTFFEAFASCIDSWKYRQQEKHSQEKNSQQ